MKRNLLLLMLPLMNVLYTKAQQGTSAFSIEPNAGISWRQGGTIGGGVFLKGQLELGGRSSVTLSAGYLSFGQESKSAGKNDQVRLVPVMAGYKYNIGAFYIEPKVGLGEIGGRYDIGGDYARPSEFGLFYGLGAGWDVNRFYLELNLGTGAQSLESGQERYLKNGQYLFNGIKAGLYLFKRQREKK
ncbi:MAG: outer membrane beta-barrel protein [Terrimonas ferruginea]|jgi:hypothetical protein|uniref:outer membrane beta-barrel protein n=1 Tax=Terrimonas ferruginea TaxID=249 RepID=UPI000A973658|nr:outer membrane beta-barrel protein [Terrimonas ferruginea]MBN8784081.1 outer membrane beta-barrel protein [Terrimonas ferruginea]